MIEAAVRKVQRVYGKGAKVGIMATDGTIEIGLYQKECEKQGLQPRIPSPENQRKVMRVIYDGIKNGGPVNYDDFEDAERQFRDEECDCVIMACTELSDYFVDAMDELALESLRLCGKKIRRKDENDR